MTDDKTPEKKIQALFFQALKPAAGREFKPSDLGVIIQDFNDIYPLAPKEGLVQVTIDFSKANDLAPYVDKIMNGAMNIDGMAVWTCVPHQNQILYRGKLENLEAAEPRDLQRCLAVSMSHPHCDDKCRAMAHSLSEAYMGRSKK
jgi:hypothetical protein